MAKTRSPYAILPIEPRSATDLVRAPPTVLEVDPLHIGNTTEKRPIAVLRAQSQESHAGLRDPRD